ncbi:hypothetical protein JG688_00013985 [Phytophthora aleatoria]|uniref:Uncharacterized protein n=1 Tax=Phytophthora aleatoria TaxID=2496075 RepID=A0A8J5ICL4_9STRA|nr:hypothetical protein JG688_00013985 [Phytophthora aleatoria]
MDRRKNQVEWRVVDAVAESTNVAVVESTPVDSVTMDVAGEVAERAYVTAVTYEYHEKKERLKQSGYDEGELVACEQ